MCCGRGKAGRIIRVGGRPNSIEQQAKDAQEEDKKVREARKAKKEKEKTFKTVL